MGKNKLDIKKILLLLNLYLILSLRESAATNLKMQNDLGKEKEGRILEVENIVTIDNPKSKNRLKIYPDEIKELVAGDVLKFSINRIFNTHKIKYEVECDKAQDDVQKILTFTLIHEDKIGPECRLVGYGHWSRRTGTTWIKRKNQE